MDDEKPVPEKKQHFDETTTSMERTKIVLEQQNNRKWKTKDRMKAKIDKQQWVPTNTIMSIPSDAYMDGYDRIFRKDKKSDEKN